MHLEQEVQFPLTGCAGAPLRGAFSLWIKTIGTGSFHQSVSHVPCRNWNLCLTVLIVNASQVSRKGFPSGEAGPKGLIGRKWNPAAKGRSMVRLPLGELAPKAAEGGIRPFNHCHSFRFSSFLPGSFPTGSSPHPLRGSFPFEGSLFAFG